VTDFEAEQTKKASETKAYSVRQLWKYGSGFLGCILFLTAILKGMPLHRLWPALGVLTLAVTMFFFLKTMEFGVIALSSWLIEGGHRPKGTISSSSGYAPSNSRSGRRRTR
jgi:hypothetical protein